ncbi:MAG: OmpA family protein [Oceanospirillales bacterium]|nr:MAG: OmpA family protein [Oceanospirillales bacterium]
MNDYDGMSPGQVLNDASVADFVKSLGLGIAEAQKALDVNSVEQLDAFTRPISGLNGKSLLELGLQPAFYHFQHADLSCSLQLSLKVQKSFGVDFGIEAKYQNSDKTKDFDENTLTQTESMSTERTQTRSAEVSIKNNSRGAMQINGQGYNLEGQSLDERIKNFAAAVRGNQDISRAIPVQNTTAISPPPAKVSADIPDDQVVFTPNSVAFIANRSDQGLIVIRENPSSAELYRLKNNVEVSVEPDTTIKDYATNVTSALNAIDHYNAELFPEEQPLGEFYFGVDLHIPYSNTAADKQRTNEMSSDDSAGRIWFLADLIKNRGIKVNVIGHASRTGSDEHNQPLSLRRAESIKSLLVSSGAPSNLIRVEGKSFADAPPADGENPLRRKVEIRLDESMQLIFVKAENGHSINRSQVRPNKLDSSATTGNGFALVVGSVNLNNLNDKHISIKGTQFTLSGTAHDGLDANSAEAFAANLVKDVNAMSALSVEATRRGHITYLSNASDEVNLILVSESSREITLNGSSGVTVKTNFTRTQTQTTRKEREGNSTVAVGASLNVRYSRQFEMEITGNSSISARLVSVPPPTEFVESMQAILNDKKGGA